MLAIAAAPKLAPLVLFAVTMLFSTARVSRRRRQPRRDHCLISCFRDKRSGTKACKQSPVQLQTRLALCALSHPQPLRPDEAQPESASAGHVL
jgi:hypothetical protein